MLKNKREGKTGRKIACSGIQFISLHEEQLLLLVLDAVSCSDTCQACRRHTVQPS